MSANKRSCKSFAVIGALAFALVATSSAYAQMGGGMMGGFSGGGGMMGGFGSGAGNGNGTMGGYGSDGRNGNGYGPGWYGDRGEAPAAPNRRSAATRAGHELGPLDQLDLSRQQREAINVINAELGDRESNLDRRIGAEQEKLRVLYDAPARDQSKIDKQFRRIDQLRREKFQSSVDARDRIEAQLSAQQRQRLQRIAPRWMTGG